MAETFETLKSLVEALPPVWLKALAAAAVAFAVTVLAVGLGRTFSRSRSRKRKEKGHIDYIQGLTYMLAGQNRQALESFSRAVRASGDNVDAYLRLGTLLRMEGHPARALRLHKSLLLRPKLPEEVAVTVLHELGLDYRALGDLDRAAKALTQVTTIDANHVEALRELRSIYEEQGRWNEAVEAEKKLLRLGASADQSGLSRLYLAWGRQQWDRGEREAAVQSFRQATRQRPSFLEAHLALGDALFELGQTQQAISAWERLMAESPEDFPLVLERLERAYFAQGKFDELRSVYLRYLDAHPEEPTVRLALAEFYMKRGRLEEAGRELEAIRGDGLGMVKAHLQLARIYHQQDRSQEAWQERLEKALEALGSMLRSFRCQACGSLEREFFWRCPSCDKLSTAARAGTP
jgi:lipopolysaccharide biosynthesis regulator YciM